MTEQLDRIEKDIKAIHEAIMGKLGDSQNSILSRLTRLETSNRVCKWLIGLGIAIMALFR